MGYLMKQMPIWGWAVFGVGIIIVCIAVAVWASLHARAAKAPELWSEEPPSNEAAP
jgi:hypothetical protein